MARINNLVMVDRECRDPGLYVMLIQVPNDVGQNECTAEDYLGCIINMKVWEGNHYCGVCVSQCGAVDFSSDVSSSSLSPDAFDLQAGDLQNSHNEKYKNAASLRHRISPEKMHKVNINECISKYGDGELNHFKSRKSEFNRLKKNYTENRLTIFDLAKKTHKLSLLF
ncbi:hypothetical protein CAPTEDRAFT_194986 [Capitella teleta]|uniref:Uncharacterized protein n=1 Tax=Capitella teleta TaxID=283909 RepID=R7VH03_CAPTE|nr:hypothetical protein CAPTEDRAFT_194986 [Capitella teleta]|eukprot:ELU17847.1 hypothetical protein CAPTEDRAFT_194986 [Capitella teleta]